MTVNNLCWIVISDRIRYANTIKKYYLCLHDGHQMKDMFSKKYIGIYDVCPPKEFFSTGVWTSILTRHMDQTAANDSLQLPVSVI